MKKNALAMALCACKGGIWHEENLENHAILGAAEKILPQ